MKIICAITLFLCGIGLVSHAQDNDEAAVRKVLANQVQAWNEGDLETFMQTYWKSDSLLFVGASGPTYGWQSTLEHYRQRYPDTVTMGKLNFDLLQVKLLSDEHSFVLGKWHLTRTTGDVGGYFTLLLKKIDGQWYIIADHTS
jgi:uncharacterized protein (TIGR02246 family)